MSGKIIVVLVFAVCVGALKFGVTIDRQKGPVCFYENLKTEEKYLFKVFADNPNFRMDVMSSSAGGRGWQTVVTKSAKKVAESINKLAEAQGIYTFCVSTTEGQSFKAQMQIQSGLELANYEYLPNLDDHQTLEREIDWMQKQKGTIFDLVSRMQNQRSARESLKSMMGVKMIMLAVVGLVVIGAVNIVFFMLAKKTLKDRKLI